MKKQTNTVGLTLGLLIGVLLMAGCSSDSDVNLPSQNDPGSQTIDLDDPNGGFLPVDEAEAFGDSELASSVAGEETLDQEEGYTGLSATQTREAIEAEEEPGVRTFCFTAVWGTLADVAANRPEPGEELGDPVDWSGSMLFSEGNIRILSLVKFERPEDYVERPRPGPNEFSWISTTRGHLDGLRVLLIVPPDSSGTAKDPILTFEVGPFGQKEFALESLSDYEEILDIQGSSEQISFRAFEVNPDIDVRGFLGGMWGKAKGDSVGVFRGRWMTRNGMVAGFVKGHYGVNSSGAQVFRGKYIDSSGRFRGFLRGQYDLASLPDDPGNVPERHQGHFWGHWVDKHGDAIGNVRGHWSARPSQERPRGSFSGVWKGTTIEPIEE